VPKLKGSCTIHLCQAEPESIGKAWSLVISDAVALGNKAIKLDPGEESETSPPPAKTTLLAASSSI
jgi:hypothetical protein